MDSRREIKKNTLSFLTWAVRRQEWAAWGKQREMRRRKRAGVQQGGSHDPIRTPQEHIHSHQGAKKATFSPAAADGSHPALPQSGLKHPIPVIASFFFSRLSSHLRWGCLAVFHSSWATAPPCGLAVGFLLRSHVWCTSNRLLNYEWDDFSGLALETSGWADRVSTLVSTLVRSTLRSWPQLRSLFKRFTKYSPV